MTPVNLFGLDSTSEVSPNAHHSVGSSFAMRYLSRYSWKVVRRGELDDYQRNGLYLGLVFEDGAKNALGGYGAGKADAEFAKKQATDILGSPANVNPVITFAVDYDPAGNASATDGYFDGVASVIPRAYTGPYGGLEVVQRSLQRGFQSPWQTYAWSGGRFAQGAKVYQYSNDHFIGGVGCDYDRAFDLSVFWNYKAQPADPFHYLWFPEGPFSWKDRSGRKIVLDERAVVQSYDAARQHPVRNRRVLQKLEAQLWALADRAYWVAHNDPATGRPRPVVIWNANHLGWRWQQLYHRYQGQKVV